MLRSRQQPLPIADEVPSSRRPGQVWPGRLLPAYYLFDSSLVESLRLKRHLGRNDMRLRRGFLQIRESNTLPQFAHENP